MPSDSACGDIGQLWQDALEAYRKEAKTDLLGCDFADAAVQCTTVQDVLDVLEENMDEFKAFRNDDSKWGKVKHVLQRFVDVILVLNDAVGDAAAAAGAPGGSAIFVGIGVLLNATKGVSDRYDSVTELFSQLQDYLTRLSIRNEAKTTLSAPARKNALDVLVHLLHVLALATKLLKKSRFAHYVQVVSGDKDMKQALERLDKLTAVETGVTISETFAATQHILAEVKSLRSDDQVQSEALERIESQVVDVKTHLSTLVHVQVQRQDVDAFNWLNPPDPSDNHRRLVASRCEDTGTWILRSSVFVAWKDGGGPFLWLYGKAGCGKSVLCSSIVDFLTITCPTFVAYYYFDFQDAVKQNADGLLRSLVHQLSGVSPVCLHLHREFYARYSSTGRPNPAALMDHLLKLLSAIEIPVYLIIDAIDECPVEVRRVELLPRLVELANSGFKHVHVLFTSRPEVDIGNTFALSHALEMNLQVYDTHTRDMSAYVSRVLGSDPDFSHWPDRLIELTRVTLAAKADGMFRWVSLQLETLRNCLPKYVEKTLSDLPKSLGDTYVRILDSIDKNVVPDVLRILSCIASSTVPLTLYELADVFAIDFVDGDGIPSIAVGNRVRDPLPVVLNLCKGLIIDGGFCRINFAHMSVKEFLFSDQAPEQYRLDPAAIDDTLAQMFMACLLSPDCLDYSQSQLSLYAKAVWMLPASRPRVSRHLRLALTAFLQPGSEAFSRWSYLGSSSHLSYEELWAPHYYLRRLVREHPLICAAFFGFQDQLDAILLNSEAITEDCAHKSLHVAIVAGLPKIMSAILESGIVSDVNAVLPFPHGRKGPSTHLHVACSLYSYLRFTEQNRTQSDEYESDFSQVSIIHLLLEHGALIDPSKAASSTALLKTMVYTWSPRRSYEGVTTYPHFTEEISLPALTLLLDHGINVNTMLWDGVTALHTAATKGDRACAIVRMLLERGATVDLVRLSDGFTVLHCATKARSIETVTTLLEHGAPVHAIDNEGLTALHHAVRNGDAEITSLLLKHGASVDARTGINIKSDYTILNTPLHLAAELPQYVYAEAGFVPSSVEESEVQKILQTLLSHGADVGARNRLGNTPLHIACVAGNPSTVRALLEAGAAVNESSGDGQTPLSLAAFDRSAAYMACTPNSRKHYFELIDMLLSWGADVNVEDEQGYTLFNRACYYIVFGNVPELLFILIEHGADINAHDLESGHTGLFVAAMKYEPMSLLPESHPDLLARIWRAGADITKAMKCRRRKVQSARSVDDRMSPRGSWRWYKVPSDLKLQALGRLEGLILEETMNLRERLV